MNCILKYDKSTFITVNIESCAQSVYVVGGHMKDQNDSRGNVDIFFHMTSQKPVSTIK